MNYYKEEELVSFVRLRLLTSEFEGLVIRIIDNGSNSRRVLEELSVDARVRIHGNGRNLGYFGGAALAVEEHKKEFGGVAELTVVSNFDLEWKEVDLAKNLFENAERTSFSVFAPRITDVNSSAEMNPYYRNRIELSKLNRLIRISSFYPLYLIYQWLHKLKRSTSSTNAVFDDLPVYAIHGSFMALKREYFQRGRGLQYGSFLYGEELFIAEECRNSGYSVGVMSSLHVFHREHTTTGSVKNKKHMKYLHESLTFIKKTYFSS
jgi:GT2 family glycosyltransferase